MRIAVSLALAVLALPACGCAEADSAIEPRLPVNAQLIDHTRVQGPDIEDGFPEVFQQAAESAPPPRRREAISLGFIGDGRLGQEPSVPQRAPDWTRPFPCHWEGTCWMVPAYTAPYVGVVASPPSP
jgi:hypothetical protein